MDVTQQKKTDEKSVISPLANEKTYGERMYSRIFDWGLNYWTNLLASAGFSHWAANSTREVKIPGFDKAAPRVLQEKLGGWIAGRWFMNGYKNRQLAEHGFEEGMKFVGKRGFAMAESLTLLVPGFVVMIPSVWIGAKIKPALVEWWNKRHYGEEAMDDPSLQARHQAIRAEERPTLLGTIIARLGTVAVVQLSAKLIGSESNTINWIGKKTDINSLKNFKGINPAAESIGGGIGSSLPASVQETFNTKLNQWGLSWSNKQLASGMNGIYNQGTQDLAKFIAMDTMYTAVSAGTIHPLIKLLRRLPGMSYKPKGAENSPTFEGDKIKIPANRYTDNASEPNATTTPAAHDTVNLGTAREGTEAANEPQFDSQKPTTKIHHVHHREPMAQGPELLPTGTGV